jgi:hypothetical protein
MRRILLGSAAALALSGSGTPTQAQSAEAIGQYLHNVLRAYAVLALRSVVEFTYETISVEPLQGTTVTGLRFHPRPPWDESGECRITIDRAAITGIVGVERIGQTIEATGVRVAGACLEPEVAGTLDQIGYRDIVADAAVIEIAYDLPTSSAKLTMQAGIADAANVTLTADFAYLWVKGLIEDEPQPVAWLRSAELSIENAGLWERVEPMVAGAVGDPKQLPGMLRGGIEGELVPQDGRPSAEVRAFLDSLEDSVADFVAAGGRLTVTAAPDGGVWLDEEAFSGPDALVAALQPVVSTVAHRALGVVDPALVAKAVAAAPDLSEADRLAAGLALMSGIGAPRDRVAGLAVLTPLAEAGNAEAAMALAEGLAQAGDAPSAYSWALRAMAGGTPGAVALADRLEENIAARAIRDTQTQVLASFAADPGLAAHRAEVLASPEAGRLRKLAFDLMLGRGVPRNYEQAYLWATLAAAAGDRTAANLRDGLDARALRKGGQPWREVFDGAAAAALKMWSDEGLGAALRARVQ